MWKGFGKLKGKRVRICDDSLQIDEWERARWTGKPRKISLQRAPDVFHHSAAEKRERAFKMSLEQHHSHRSLIANVENSEILIEAMIHASGEKRILC